MVKNMLDICSRYLYKLDHFVINSYHLVPYIVKVAFS